MITTSFIVSTIVGLLGGATVGAAVTGGLAIKAKEKKRVQKRRELVYVDVLAWVYTRMPTVRSAKARTATTPPNGKLANPPPSAAAPDSPPSAAAPDSPPSAAAPDSLPSAAAPDRKSTFPDSMALDPYEDADPGTPYFVTLHARVMAFGSHDMARAFDTWTKLYKKILDDSSSANASWFRGITNADAIISPDPPPYEENPHHAFARFMKRQTVRRQAKREFKALNGRSRRWDAGLPDPVKGGLTMAIEHCASKELRKG